MSTMDVAVGPGEFVLEVITSVGFSAGTSVAVVVVEADVLQELIIKMIQSSIKTKKIFLDIITFFLQKDWLTSERNQQKPLIQKCCHLLLSFGQ